MNKWPERTRNRETQRQGCHVGESFRGSGDGTERARKSECVCIPQFLFTIMALYMCFVASLFFYACKVHQQISINRKT